MGILADIRNGITTRCLLAFRADTAALAPLVPAGMRPVRLRGASPLFLVFTHLGYEGARWWSLPRVLGSHHMSLLVPVEVAEPRGQRSMWIPRRYTSSWFGACCAGRLLPGSYRHCEVDSFEDGPSLEVCVRSSIREELYLRAELSSDPRAPAGLFASVGELEAFLAEPGAVHPPNPFAPALDRVGSRRGGWTLERLTVLEARLGLLDGDDPLPAEGIELESAYRVLPVRVARHRAPLRQADDAGAGLGGLAPAPRVVSVG